MLGGLFFKKKPKDINVNNNDNKSTTVSTGSESSTKSTDTQEFLDHLRRFNLDEKQIKDLPKSDLVEKILSEYIGKKVMALEIQELGIIINDNSLRKIIKKETNKNMNDNPFNVLSQLNLK